MLSTFDQANLLERLMIESQANNSVPMEESQRLYIDATRNLVVEVKKEKVEQERLQNELAQRPKILSLGDFKLPDQQVRFYSIEGVLNKKETKSAAWQKYYFRFLPLSLELVYYPSKDDYIKGKTGSIIPVSWVWTQKAEEEDGLMQKQVQFSLLRKTKVEVCIWRTTVYSPRRTYILSAHNDSEMQKWVHNITAVLGLMLSKQEMDTRTEAAQKLTPLLINQLKMEKEQYKLIVQSLQTAGIFPDRPTGKRREGYLEMQKADGSWKKYYFVLFKESLSYFNLDDKVLLPRGVILLESISSIRKIIRSKANSPGSTQSPSKSPPTALLEEYGLAPMDIETTSNNKKEDNKQPKQQFEILTPLRTYTLRAKHAEAMRDWSIAIQQMIGADKLPLDASIAERNPEEIPGLPVLGAKYFSTNAGGKSKKFAMKKENVVLGRSTKSDVVVTDVKVSRNHCRVEMTPSGVPILYDLGSLGGTFVNGKKVIKSALKPGDKITIGTTDIIFLADAPKAK